MALSLGGCFILATPPRAFAQTGEQQHQKTAPSGGDDRGKSAAPRKTAPRDAAPRKSAPREAAPRKAAPRDATPRKTAPAGGRSPQDRPTRGRSTQDRATGGRTSQGCPTGNRPPYGQRAWTSRPADTWGRGNSRSNLRRGAADTAHVGQRLEDLEERSCPERHRDWLKHLLPVCLHFGSPAVLRWFD